MSERLLDNRRTGCHGGERMSLNGFCEISAVCTHPNHVGRGYARRLMSKLINDGLIQGVTPFLRVGQENERARLLYERLGFVARRDIALALVRRKA